MKSEGMSSAFEISPNKFTDPNTVEPSDWWRKALLWCWTGNASSGED